MQRFFEFFRKKNYAALWNNLLNRFYLPLIDLFSPDNQLVMKMNNFLYLQLI